jgi:elongation factor G
MTEAMPKCKPVLLEPLDELEIVTPDEYLGDVLGDLSSRRGHILGTEASDEGSVVKAIVPQAEMYMYASSLQSMTQGRATFKHRFHGYEEMPPDAAQRVISEHSREHEEVLAH